MMSAKWSQITAAKWGAIAGGLYGIYNGSAYWPLGSEGIARACGGVAGGLLGGAFMAAIIAAIRNAFVHDPFPQFVAVLGAARAPAVSASVPPPETMAEDVGFRVRLRVRLAKALNEEATTRTISVGGREVTVVSQKPNQPLSEATWIIIGARGFPTEQEARDYGEMLRNVAEIAGLCSRLGVDVGRDRPTSWVDEDYARAHGHIQPAERLFPNVHGLMIVPDDELSRFPLIEASAIVRAAPDHFLGAMAELGHGVPAGFSSASTGVRLLNLALINPEPMAQIALSLSAVEALGQNETWTKRQIALIRDLAAQLESGADTNDAERLEIAEALRRSFHRIGLRQGVMRVLAELGLERLRKEWDRIYAARSGLFHGSLTLPEPEVAQLAVEAMTLCGRIVLAAVERHGVRAASIALEHFPN